MRKQPNLNQFLFVDIGYFNFNVPLQKSVGCVKSSMTTHNKQLLRTTNFQRVDEESSQKSSEAEATAARDF